MTALALEFGRALGELERAGASVFEDCAREHEPLDVEERLLNRAGARGTAGAWALHDAVERNPITPSLQSVSRSVR